MVRDAFDRLAVETDRLLQRPNAGVLTVSLSRNFATKRLVHRLGRFAEAQAPENCTRKCSQHIGRVRRNAVPLHTLPSKSDLVASVRC